MKKLTPFLFLILFCCCSFTSVGQESEPINPYEKYDLALTRLIIGYNKFLESPKTKRDSITLKHKVSIEKKYIDIKGEDIGEYEIEVGIRGNKPINIPDGLLKTHNVSYIRNRYKVSGSIELEHLLDLKIIDGIKTIDSAQLVSENLNEAVVNTNIDDVWNAYSNMALEIANDYSANFCGEKEINGTDVVVGIIESNWPRSTHNTFKDADSNSRIEAYFDKNGILTTPPTYTSGKDHPTLVGGIASGRGETTSSGGTTTVSERGVAYNSDIFFGKASSVKDIVDVVEYMIVHKGDRPLVINISLGAWNGPHDGSDRDVKDLSSLVSDNSQVIIVAAAANQLQFSGHCDYQHQRVVIPAASGGTPGEATMEFRIDENSIALTGATVNTTEAILRLYADANFEFKISDFETTTSTDSDWCPTVMGLIYFNASSYASPTNASNPSIANDEISLQYASHDAHGNTHFIGEVKFDGGTIVPQQYAI